MIDYINPALELYLNPGSTATTLTSPQTSMLGSHPSTIGKSCLAGHTQLDELVLF